MSMRALRARPMFARTCDAGEAHLTVVFAALVVSRQVQTRTGLAIGNIIRQLRSLPSATVATSGTTETFHSRRQTHQPRCPRNPKPWH